MSMSRISITFLAVLLSVSALADVPTANLTLTTGGVSQVLAPAASGGSTTCQNFVYVSNASTSGGEGGVGPESIYVNITGSAATSSGGDHTVEIPPGVVKAFYAQTTAITWIAPTTGHKIGAVCQ